MLGIITAMPIIVRELAEFIGPGLYQHEKTTVKKFTASAIVPCSQQVAYSLILLLYLTYLTFYTDTDSPSMLAHSLI